MEKLTPSRLLKIRHLKFYIRESKYTRSVEKNEQRSIIRNDRHLSNTKKNVFNKRLLFLCNTVPGTFQYRLLESTFTELRTGTPYTYSLPCFLLSETVGFLTVHAF